MRVRCAQVKIVNRKCVEARKSGPPPLSEVETVHEIYVMNNYSFMGLPLFSDFKSGVAI